MSISTRQNFNPNVNALYIKRLLKRGTLKNLPWKLFNGNFFYAINHHWKSYPLICPWNIHFPFRVGWKSFLRIKFRSFECKINLSISCCDATFFLQIIFRAKISIYFRFYNTNRKIIHSIFILWSISYSLHEEYFSCKFCF